MEHPQWHARAFMDFVPDGVVVEPRGEFMHQVITNDENPEQIKKAEHEGEVWVKLRPD